MTAPRYYPRMATARKSSPLPDQYPEAPDGHSGTPIVGGRQPREYEHNNRLSAMRDRALIHSQMMRTSHTISLAEELLTGLVTAARLRVDRTENTDEGAADALEWWLGLGRYENSGGRLGVGTTDALVRHMMSARMYGNVLLSESWEYDKARGLYACALHRRRQTSYMHFIVDDRERLIAVEQRLDPLGRSSNAMLHIDRSLWMVNRPDIGWHRGESILRSVFGDWRDAQNGKRTLASIVHRHGDPPVIATLDVAKFTKALAADGLSPTIELIGQEIADFESKVNGLASDQFGHLIKADWWTVEPRSNHEVNFDGIIGVINFHQRCIAERLYIAWVQQGRAGTGGSRAMVDTQSKVITDAVVDSLQWVVQGLNAQTVRRFLDVNFSNLSEEERPVVTFDVGSIRPPKWAENPTAFASMVAQRLITPTPALEQSLRARLDLPPAGEDELPGVDDRAAARAGGASRTPAGQRSISGGGKYNQLIERGDEEAEE